MASEPSPPDADQPVPTVASEPAPPDADEPVPTEELWRVYKKSGGEEVRQELVRRHQPLVRYLAEHMVQKLPRSVDVDDLVQEGIFGLMDAIEKFDPERGIKFKTYCSTRVRGAILDSLRHQDWVPRLARQRANKVAKMKEEWQYKFNREPTDDEIADYLEIPEKDLAKTRPHAMHNLSDRRVSPSAEVENQIDTLGESGEENPLDFTHRQDLIKVLTSSLSDKERHILQMYYLQGLTLREIGAVLSITESRVCQIHSNVIKRLRQRLDKDSGQFEI
jgi:RNA polymerase sigma factor for flagellar operon FliA